VVAAALAAFSLGLTFNGAMLMLNRAFFSLQSPWLPTVIAVANLALNAALDWAFYRLGTWGIPLSTSLVNIAGTALLLLLLRRRLRRIDFARTADATVRIVIAAAVLAGVSYGVWRGLDEALGRALWAQLISVGTALAAGTAAYLVSCRLLGVRELNALLALRERLRRR
jgi:putative peptidoglycan lipid II flippase